MNYIATFHAPIQVRSLANSLHVLVIHRNKDVARGLAVLLGSENNIQISASATNLQHGAHWARIKQPDVVVLDADLPHVSPEWSVDHIREGAPAAEFVLISSRTIRTLPFRESNPIAGAEVVMANEPVEVLVKAVKRATFRGPVMQRLPSRPAA